MTLYVACAIFGGLLILLSLIGHDHGADTGHDLDHDAGADGHDFGHFLAWFPILSVRFWAFALGAFGLTGILLIKVAGMSEAAALWTSVVTGVLSGFCVVLTLRALMRHSANAMATEDDLRGIEATVTVAIRGNDPGRIRCYVKGEILDLLAVSSEQLEAGAKVVVIDIENNRAKVVSRDSILAGDTPDSLEMQNS